MLLLRAALGEEIEFRFVVKLRSTRFWKHNRIEFKMHSSRQAPTRGRLLEFEFRKSLALFTARQTDSHGLM
jgi:hypothetical protein